MPAQSKDKDIETYESFVDPIYDRVKANHYAEMTGSSKFYWLPVTPEIGTVRPDIWNSASGQGPVLAFERDLNTDQYVLKDLGIYAIVQLTKTLGFNPAGSAAYQFTGSINDNCSFQTDAWFQTIKVMIDGQDISATTGKNNAFKAAHVKRLLQETPDYNLMIRGDQWAYIDTGVGNYNYAAAGNLDLTCGASANRVDKNIYCNVQVSGVANALSPVIGNNAAAGSTTIGGVRASSAGITNAIANLAEIAQGTSGGAIAFGAANAGALQGAGVATSLSADGNPFFFMQNNPYFNEGFYQKCIRTNSGFGVAIWIPLRNYCCALEALASPMTNFKLRVELTRTSPAVMCFEANAAVDATAGSGQWPAPAFPYFQRIELHVPCIKPDTEMQKNINNTLAGEGITTTRKYIDIDVVQYGPQISGSSLSIVLPSAVDRKLLGVMAALQFVNDTGPNNYSGNCHRYFNPQIKSAIMRVSDGQNFPYTPLLTNPATGIVDDVTLWRELMKIADIEGNNQTCLIDHRSFINHKFFVCFDTREAEPFDFITRGPQALSFELSWAYNIPQLNSIAGAGAPAAGLAAGVNNGAHGRFLAEAPNGPAYMYAFIFQERAMTVTERAGKVTILSNAIYTD